MMETWIVLLVLAAVGVVVLGGLVLSVVLILSERTRVAGIVLLVLLLLGVPLVGIGLATFWAVVRSSEPVRVRQPEPQRWAAPIEIAPPPMPEAPEAVPTDEPAASEDADRPGQTEQPSTADEPDPGTAATH